MSVQISHPSLPKGLGSLRLIRDLHSKSGTVPTNHCGSPKASDTDVRSSVPQCVGRNEFRRQAVGKTENGRVDGRERIGAAIPPYSTLT
ncbi:MAG: hypothetical protein ACREI1_09795 [Nitrospiraceae bacterium]